MLAAYFSHEGPTREDNQDAVLVGGVVRARTERPEFLESAPEGVFAVADGVGGYRGGGVAASLLLENLKELALNSGTAPDAEDLAEICRRASAGMRALAEEDPRLSGMSSTLAGVAVAKDELAVFNCGDCRVYRLGRPFLRKLSHDHSVVQTLFDSGQIDEDAMRTHPRKNVVLSGVGVDEAETLIFLKKFPFAPPLVLFLCSDGVWETLSLDSLEEILDRPVREAAETLADELFERKAQDNISFLILEF